MLSLIYTTIRHILKYPISSKAETEDINDIISHIEHANDTDACVEKDRESLNEEGCYYKTGSVTSVSVDHIIIDDRYLYEKTDALSSNLKIGDKIYYLAFLRHPTAELKVRKIISVINNESWDDENPENVPTNSEKDTVHTRMIQRNIIAKVTKREGRIVIVEPNNIHIDLGKIGSVFIPLVGDWLNLESLVEVNNNFADLSGEVLEVDKIRPLRSKLHVGVISKYDPANKTGIIDKYIVFHKSACEPGYMPCIGDKVVSDSIESDQGHYTWRSVTVVPLIQVSSKSVELPNISDLHLAIPNMNNLLENKCGIIIDDELKFNLNIEQENTLTVFIRNTANYIHILQGGYFMPQKTQSQLSVLSPIERDINIVINPSESVSYTFKCQSKFVGASKELFVFNFKDFKIGRLFHITINAKKVSRKTYSKAVRQRNSRKIDVSNLDELNEVTYIPGIRPYKSPAFIKIRTGIFKIPRYVWDAVLNTMKYELSQTEYEYAVGWQIPCLLKPLFFETYQERFHALLYLEEIAQILTLQQYDMESAVMCRRGNYLVLQVPGLTEKRPSLLAGDRAIISFEWDSSRGKLKYEGFIHKVTSNEVFLKFNERFHQTYNNEHCQIRFKCSNTTIQRGHNAINLAINHLGFDFLFPTKVVQKEPQFHLEEYEIEERSSREVCHKKNGSVSSSSSYNSIASVNDTSFDSAIKTSPIVSIAERLFNAKPFEPFEDLEAKMSTIKIGTDQDLKTNLTKTISYHEVDTTNIIDSEKTDKAISPTDSELEPYINQIRKRKLNWFNKNLNYYQKEAIRNILKGLARPLPYVIFGPPGTGKTITLCETILQIFAVIPESRLLIATPSNSSANLIAERLLESGILKPGDLVRLIAHHCLDSDFIPEKLLPYCATAELAAEGTRESPKHHGGPKLNCTMSVLGRHRITVGTCSALGILYNMGFPRGHFSHVLVDEAGQATEPEIMIPLNFIHSDNGQVILAGDPMQLGPVVQSRLATYFGFGESFLSRLLCQFPYQRDPEGFETSYDPRLVTKLVMNYRSLPEILHLSNSLFYELELQPQISPEESKEAELLQMLKTELPQRNGLPPAIVFHGVNGENHRDSDSPSWYNPEEATQVYLYLVKLYKYGVEPDDIGIITPYQKQVLQIRDLLSEVNLKMPKISSVEGFQGQERKIIILSAVRSCNDLVNEDIKHALGFVASPRRLNVAITRARALVIILGNPELLALDPYWRSVLIYCIDRGAYTGCNFLPSEITNLQM